ncbi:MAG: hypothetical protein ABSH56_34915 [Bryobacteraceae bacterium]|jgi:hypothetical protein
MSRFRLRAALFLLLVVSSGCAIRPSGYRLIENPKPILLPPGVANAGLSRRTFVAAILPGPGPCTLHDTAIQLQLRKKTIRMTVNRDALQTKPPGWLADWSIVAERQGCVASGSGQDLANLIAESLPLDPAAVFRLLNPNHVLRGYVDLGAENRLQVHSPVLREGTPADAPILDTSTPEVSGSGSHLQVDLKLAPGVIGFETAWYAVRRNMGRPGYHFEAMGADRDIQGKVEHAPAPATDYFEFPPEASFFRLLYKSDSSGITAIVAFGATPGELDARTTIALADPDVCEKPAPPCRALPHKVGVNPYLAANVQGREVTVPLGANVAAAIQAGGVKNPDSVLPQLSIARPFGKRLVPVAFDRQSRAILNLQLTGGERISWSAKTSAGTKIHL